MPQIIIYIKMYGVNIIDVSINSHQKLYACQPGGATLRRSWAGAHFLTFQMCLYLLINLEINKFSK